MVQFDKPGKHSPKQKPGEPVFARVPLSELTLGETRAAIEAEGGDTSFFDETRMAILYHFQVGVEEYEALTVGTHAEMVDYLRARGEIVDGE